jgi:hypothetical protein
MLNLKSLPKSRKRRLIMEKLKNFYQNHPIISQWIILAVGMVIILIVAAKDQGFNLKQWLALISATVILAGLCVWIINWE